jgi:DNA-binding NtrC family response regulator
MSNILVIDDDDQVRAYFKILLEENGYSVDTAENGLKGMNRLKEKQYSIVILDLLMPEKEGMETLMEMKKTMPEIKVITVSGGGKIGPESYLSATRILGAEYAFPKPVDQQELLDAVSRVSRELKD